MQIDANLSILGWLESILRHYAIKYQMTAVYY